LQADSSLSPALTTTVRSGRALELAPSTASIFSGGALHITHVRIEEEIDYSQYSNRHLLHVTLSGRTSRSVGRVGRGEWIKVPDRRGSISFTPGGRERHGLAGRGQILGLQLEFDEQFVQDACEQRLRGNWGEVFNSSDAKIFAIAEMAAMGLAQGTCDRLTLDMLQLALARHIGRTYGKADRRSDDGWLHPAALARVIEQLLADPTRSVSLPEMARSAGLGVSAFVRAFRGSVGSTPAAFALKLRLDHASDILRSTHFSLSEVAALSGFASAAHLVRTFRAHRSITPGRLRREADRDGFDGISQNPREYRRPNVRDTPEQP
jgi:AraC-like DNA-binding protein